MYQHVYAQAQMVKIRKFKLQHTNTDYIDKKYKSIDHQQSAYLNVYVKCK